MSYLLETERLLFRRVTMNDLDKIVETRSDPDVNKYLGGPEAQNREAIEKRMPFYIGCFEKFGFGFSSMIWKETGEVIGSAGLSPLGDTGEIEVGYNMIKPFWGKGIGTEAAMGWLSYGFNTAGLERIVAVAHQENHASQNIMKKCGMTFENITRHYEMDCVLYAISKDEFFRFHPELKQTAE